MIIRIEKLKKSYFFILLICIMVAATSSFSHAKFLHEQKYPMELNFIQEPVHFTFEPGLAYDFVIPTSGYYAFQLWGGCGGTANQTRISNGYEEHYELGGSGGFIGATRYFDKGTTLIINVGNGGSIVNGGYNGGGSGGSGSDRSYYYFGGGGGGATDVRFSPGTIFERILVAGGGGGAGSGNMGLSGTFYNPGTGGNAGTMENLIGCAGIGEGSGYGGTMEAGGEGFMLGTPGMGGFANHSGGGGGSGYFGGGGAFGSGGGGGGGSSYISGGFLPGISSGLPKRSTADGNHDGYAIITFLGDEYNYSL